MKCVALIGLTSRKVPTVSVLPWKAIVPRIGVTEDVLGSMRQKPRLVVSRKSPLLGSISRPLTYGGLREKSTSRDDTPDPLAAASDTFDAVPASASSHSASEVKPTITPSIQYCERTASLARLYGSSARSWAKSNAATWPTMTNPPSAHHAWLWLMTP